MPDQDHSVIWLRPEVTGRGRAPGHSRLQIAQAALAVADAEGLDAASMRRVATEIGAAPMSLYRYVRNKDELHLLMADEAVRQDWQHWRPLPDTDWNLTLRRAAHNVRRLVLAHPWWAEIVTRGPGFTPHILRTQEKTLAGLDGLGLTIDEMTQIAETVQTFVIGYAQREFHTARAIAADGSATAAEMLRDWQPYVASLIDSGEFPYLERIVLDARAPHETDRQALFERALDRLVAGIAATLPHPWTGTPGHALRPSPAHATTATTSGKGNP